MDILLLVTPMTNQLDVITITTRTIIDVNDNTDHNASSKSTLVVRQLDEFVKKKKKKNSMV
jgi:hypothetical protein